MLLNAKCPTQKEIKTQHQITAVIINSINLFKNEIKSLYKV